MIEKIRNRAIGLWQSADSVMRSKAVDTISYEIEELEHIFAILVLGAFVGLPSPPIQITMDLIADMEHEFDLMLSKVATARDPLGDLFSVLGIE